MDLNGQNQNGSIKGLSVSIAIIFIVGTMCGSGILALPQAIVNSGWFGIIVLILCGIISSYTGGLLGKCWVIIKRRYPEYDDKHIADPYPTIGFRAAGKWGRMATRFCIVFTLFGSGVVYLLLIVENIDNLIVNMGHASFHTCYLIPILGAVLLPLSWLGTPKDFWQAAVIAAVTSSLGAIFIVAGLAVMAVHLPPASHSYPSFGSFFTAFGKILFAFGGASIFPTIQVDMKDPKKFSFAVVMGITSVMVIYLTISIAGFVVLGDSMTKANILDNMEGNWILYTVIFLVTSHFFLGFIIVVNPVSQDLESLLGIEDKFSLKRVFVRTLMMLLIVLVALAVPHFDIILSLVGASTITATNFVFPPLFYILLSRQKSRSDGFYAHEDKDASEEEVRPLLQQDVSNLLHNVSVTTDDPRWINFDIQSHIKVLLVEIMLIGIVGGTASVYSAIAALVDGSSDFTAPCFSNWAAADVKLT